MNRAVAVVRACGGDARLQAECRTRWELAREGLLQPARDHHEHRAALFAPPGAGTCPGDTPTVFESVTHGEWRVVRLSGEWDLFAAASLRTQLDAALDDARHPHIVVDLSRTTFLGSVVLGTLVYVLQALHFRGASLRLVPGVGEHSLERVCRVFVITGLHRFMPIHPTLDDARAPALDGFDPFEPGPVNDENSAEGTPIRFVLAPHVAGAFRVSRLTRSVAGPRHGHAAAAHGSLPRPVFGRLPNRRPRRPALRSVHRNVTARSRSRYSSPTIW
nr:STAS domain-containing protein [Streptomyces sp. SID3343]